MKIIELRPNGTKRVAIQFDDVSKTDQSWAEHVNINNIVERFLKTGQFDHLAKHQGLYLDVSEIPDLPEAIMKVRSANEAFASLPAEIRDKFQNDPVAFVDFLQDPNNTQQAIDMGLLPKDLTSQKQAENTNDEKLKNDDSNSASQKST